MPCPLCNLPISAYFGELQLAKKYVIGPTFVLHYSRYQFVSASVRKEDVASQQAKSRSLIRSSVSWQIPAKIDYSRNKQIFKMGNFSLRSLFC
jgi:hypothetical protein